MQQHATPGPTPSHPIPPIDEPPPSDAPGNLPEDDPSKEPPKEPPEAPPSPRAPIPMKL
jgi:hypothetical protein